MITFVDTPNPESKKFIFDFNIVSSGSKEIKSINDCNGLKFAERLFKIIDPDLIYIDTNFITIKKNVKKNWDDIKEDVLKILSEEIGKDFEPLIFAKLEDFKDEISKRIEEVLNEKIRPAVAMDGGDIQLKSYKNGVVEVLLKGSCAGCPSSVVTLKQGVERMIKHYVPEVNSVMAVDQE